MEKLWDHIIKNGTIVTSGETFPGNIYVKDGKIHAITCEDLEGEAYEVTDATGKYVLPGLIDAHVHSREGKFGAHHKEDFYSSTTAAACGGFTTIFEMPNTNPTVHSGEILEEMVRDITPKAFVDFGVWAICLGPLNNERIPELSKAGAIGFKYFWGYAIDKEEYQLVYNYSEDMENIIPPLDDGEVYRIFREVAKTGQVVAIHGENFFIIKTLTEEIKKRGEDTYEAILSCRPPVVETTVIDTAIRIAEAVGARLHILHLAAGDGVEIIREAKERGVKVTVETCPQYLGLTNEDADKAGPKLKCYPLVRTKKDKELLWDGLSRGIIDYITSDHAPHTAEEKKKGFWDSPAGITGIETMLPVLLTGVNEGRIDITDVARLMSENPAKINGIYPQKGSLEIGTDADITIVNLEDEFVFREEMLHSKHKISPFDGTTFKGRAVKTILRGRTISENGEIVGEPEGRFVRPNLKEKEN